MKRLAILVLSATSAAFGQCQAISASRPRIYLPNAAYGSFATVLARLQAAAAAKSGEWKALLAQATPYLNTEPNAYFYDSVGMEMALIYQVNTTTYASYGARALHFMYEAMQNIAPTVDITAATNANPTVFATASPHRLSSRDYKAPVWGGTGNWAAFNQASGYRITVIDATHFSVAIDSTSLGALTGNMTVSANGFTNLNQARWNTPMEAAIWDWTHALIGTALTADQANQLENTMTASISYAAANPYEWVESTPNPVGGIANLNIGPINGALQMAVALSGDVAGMDAICSSIRSQFLAMVPIYTTGATGTGYHIFPLGHGGAYVESTEYSPEVQFYLMCYLEVMLGATGENLYSTISGFPAAAVQFLFNDVSPGNTAAYKGGGTWGELLPYHDILYGSQHIKTLNGISRQNMEQLVFYLCSSGDNTDCSYGEWWLQNVFTQAQLNTQGNVAISPFLNVPSEFLFYDPKITATDPRSTYGPDYLADGYSLMLSRSAWTTSATWVGFLGGGLRGSDEDHWHSDILSFEIYRNGDWLTTNLTNYSGTKLTRINNVPVPETNQFGTFYEGSNPPSSPNNVFAWGTTGMTSDGSVTQHEFNTTLGYAYAESNATTPYNGQTNPYGKPPYTAQITAVIRDFLYLKPDTYVVEDRLAYATPLKAEWNIQALANPGTPSGSNFTLASLNGHNLLNVAIISPTSPTISVANPATQATEIGCSAGVSCPSQWRVQISSGNTVRSEQYFVVMQSGATGFTPVTVSTLTATNAIAAQFAGYVIGGMIDTSQTGVTRSYTFTNLGSIHHIFMGLKPSTAYKVDTKTTSGTVTVSDSGSGTSVMTTTGGVLLFNTSSTSTPATQ